MGILSILCMHSCHSFYQSYQKDLCTSDAFRVTQRSGYLLIGRNNKSSHVLIFFPAFAQADIYPLRKQKNQILQQAPEGCYCLSESGKNTRQSTGKITLLKNPSSADFYLQNSSLSAAFIWLIEKSAK